MTELPEFEELYKEYHPVVFRYLLSLCQDVDVAEEITQETFFKVLKNINQFQGQCKFSSWLCQIAKNTYFSYYKKQKRIILQTENSEEIEANKAADATGYELSPEQMVLNKELELRIHQILHKMKEPYREVFWMRIFGELTFQEIAAIHHKGESWARVTYHRAKLQIKEELE